MTKRKTKPTPKPSKATTPASERALARQVDLVRRGKCRNCGRPRGKTGTKQHCRGCADDHAEYLRGRYRERAEAHAKLYPKLAETL